MINPEVDLRAIIDEDRLIEIFMDDEAIGFCTHCGNEVYNVEPDAENYECEACGRFEVFGAMHIALMLS